MMTSRYGIFCLILFFGVLALGVQNYEVWSRSGGAVIKREVPKKPETKAETPLPAVSAGESIAREVYKAIAEKNIFHPDRQEFPAAAGAEQGKPAARPQIALYGVVVGGELQSATIVNPGRTLMKGEREAKTVKLGDRIGDYKVSSIQEDRIVMESAGDSFEVLLYDPSAPKKRVEVKTPVQPVAVTSSIAAPAATPGAPGPPATGAPAAVRTPVGGPASGAQPAARTPAPGTQISPSKPAEPKTGTALQPPSAQTPPAVTPGTGIWRGRRPVQPADPATPQGN